jgi:hypothetical protein
MFNSLYYPRYSGATPAYSQSPSLPENITGQGAAAISAPSQIPPGITTHPAPLLVNPMGHTIDAQTSLLA